MIIPHYTYLNNYDSYINAIIRVANMNNVDYINLYHTSKINEDNYKKYTTDGVHLNSDGYLLIARCIGQSMIENLY